jgi:hypothetical protein
MKSRVLGLVLGVLCSYHLGVGLASTLAPDTVIFLGEWLYGLQVDGSAAQFAYMIKALGMYALFTGGLCAVALFNPIRYRGVVVALAALLIMRAITRLMFFDMLNDAFGVGWGRNLFHVALLVGKGAALLWACPAVTSTDGEPAPKVDPLDRPVRVPARRRPVIIPTISASGVSGRLASASGAF